MSIYSIPTLDAFCEGCNTLFSSSGYSRHLATTTNPRCRAILDQADEYMPGVHDQDQPPSAPCFEGDFFGQDYSEHDFGREPGGYQHPTDNNDDEIQDVEIQDDGIQDDEIQDDHLDFDPNEPDWEPEVDEQYQGPPLHDEEHLPSESDNKLFPKSKGNPGAPISSQKGNNEYQASQAQFEHTSARSPYAPFISRLDWEFARWVKLRGPGSTAINELLALDNMAEKLGLSYKNSVELHKITDESLPGRPRFKREEIVVAGESFDIYFRDVIECVRALFRNPEFAAYLVFSPEQHYSDPACHSEHRIYHEMHTGKWWWSTQIALEEKTPGATIIPIIISSDKTQLTLFRGKTAYPVYLTIGNIPKEIRKKPSRQAQILLDYLPTTRLKHITSPTSRRRALANLFHRGMKLMLDPLVEAGKHGLPMRGGDGVLRRCHLLFAAFVGDYPEQLLVTCTKVCPTCDVPRDELGSGDLGEPRDLQAVLEALELVDGPPGEFFAACRGAGIKPIVHPFWEGFPYTNIFRAITPDILHQLYQALIKHLVAWLTNSKAFGPIEVDARCRRMPPNHTTRLFTKGITTLSRVSGQEHRDIARIVMGLIVDLRLLNGHSTTRLLLAVRGMLDFLYLAQYKAHRSTTLGDMDAALRKFHANKNIFVDLGVRARFQLPKLHNAGHYRYSIELFGTTENYNTQTTERLHIDYAKDAYNTSNTRNAFAQMTKWLERYSVTTTL
ncbi:hypothetical protein QCA50_020521 [Cerrena zonata]|uniref:Uncharacterized protein n=1 Tax=Cerrena zonata TaxID=2478898 RepID=A0AAW0FG29_9APHY